MTKVLFLLSAVVMVVAGFFTYQNREAFISTRVALQKSDAELSREKNKLGQVADEIVGVKGKINAVNTEVSNESERLAQAKIKLRNSEGDATRYQRDLDDAQGKIKGYQAQVENLPEGVNMENLPEAINKLKQEIADSEGQSVKLQEDVTAKDAEVKKAQDGVSDVRERIEARKKLYDRNSMTATIVAVNNDWGFVIIDGGQNKGITVDTKLLVTRGPQTIGRLNIINVEGNKTVANIDQTSLREGLAVSPGDRVILESLFQ
ncbi:MAG: hypothetical protein ACOYMN_21690 [Roseimicrobium sp.]